jgi:hypothetical protein
MLQRFVERYQMWRGEKAQENRDKNPLSGLALVAILLLAIDIYKVASSHQLTWRPVCADVLLVAFLVLYLRHSRVAWVVIPIIGLLCLLQAPIVYFSTAWRYSLRVRVISLCFGLALGVVALAYGLVARRRYQLYLDERTSDKVNI